MITQTQVLLPSLYLEVIGLPVTTRHDSIANYDSRKRLQAPISIPPKIRSHYGLS